MKLKTETFHTFEHRDLEKLVKELYGYDINILDERFIPFEYIGQYTYHEWTVDGESELDTIGDKEIVAKWIETGQMDQLEVPEVDWLLFAEVGLNHIMHRLFIEGHIPAGKYQMKVWW